MSAASSIQIPSSFRYFDNRHTGAGRKVASVIGRFVDGPLALPDVVAGDLGRDRARGDELSDAFISAAFANNQSHGARRMVEHALEHGIESIPDASPELIDLFEHLDAEPDWLDWERVERGAAVLRRYGVDAFYYFGLISLDGYRREMIFKPLVLTGTYTGGTAFGRYVETCRFWLDVSEPGALRQGGAGRKTSVLIRVMHSMIRRRIAPHPEWDAERLGVPLSQNPQFGTVMLSFLLNQHAKKIGYLPTDAEILDHMHFWRYVAYLLGVEPAYYPDTIEDWWRIVYLMALEDDPADGDDSRMLSQSFVAAFGPSDTDTKGVRRSKVREQLLILGWTRFFLPKEVFTANQLPQPGWRRWLPLARLLPNLRDEICRRWIPGYDQRLDTRKRARRTAWLNEHTQGRAAQFTPVEMLSR